MQLKLYVNITMTERKCKCCEQIKEIDEFYIMGISKKTNNAIHRYKCKKCMMKNITLWKSNNKSASNGYVVNWINNNKERFSEYQRKYQNDHYDPVLNHERYLNRRLKSKLLKNMNLLIN